jgi:hypothetical protein
MHFSSSIVFQDIIVTEWTPSRKGLKATIEKAMFSLDLAVLCPNIPFRAVKQYARF